jgi:hypothetical protein
MRHLSRPTLDAEALYLRISGTRPIPPRTRLLGARDSVFAAYDAYLAASVDVTDVVAANTAPATPDDLVTNYDNRSLGCLALRSAIFGSNSGGKCAFCDRATATTLDHYLPKGGYPEFSILPLNLIPCCAECNLRKLGAYRDEAAIFLHSYFDEIPAGTQVVFAEVEVLPEGVVFNYRIDPPNALGVIADRVRQHFAALALAECYALEAVHETAERAHELRRLHEATNGDSERIRGYLQQEAESVAAAKGCNHWRAVALAALAQSQAFCSGGYMDPPTPGDA